MKTKVALLKSILHKNYEYVNNYLHIYYDYRGKYCKMVSRDGFHRADSGDVCEAGASKTIASRGWSPRDEEARGVEMTNDE